MEREPLLEPEASRTVRLEAEGADERSDGGIPRPVRYEWRGQRSDVRGQRTEDRGQRTEDRGQNVLTI